MAARKSIWLKDYRRNNMFPSREEDFKVNKLKNSTTYSPGDYLSEREVNNLIRTGWDVIIEEKKNV